MKLLILTQKVDKEDPILGFFHKWIEKFSEKFEAISVVCLEKGKYDLPQNVKVFSLGKERTITNNRYLITKIKYIFGFFRFSFFSSLKYDAVFVHMNQEYVLLGGIFWRILGKKIYLWRNHPKGNFLTKIAVWLSDGIFCTSKFAFVAKYNKTKLMPVGIDTEMFQISNPKSQIPNSILFLGRISPIKKPDILIEALGVLNEKGTDFICHFYGNPLPRDEIYYNSLKQKTAKLGLTGKIGFYGEIPNYKTPRIYNEHEIFVNLTPTGSFDKTILEAAACGCITLVANKSLSGEIDNELILDGTNPEDLASKIEFWLKMSEVQKKETSKKLQKYTLEKHGLDDLIIRFVKEIKNGP